MPCVPPSHLLYASQVLSFVVGHDAAVGGAQLRRDAEVALRSLSVASERAAEEEKGDSKAAAVAGGFERASAYQRRKEGVVELRWAEPVRRLQARCRGRQFGGSRPLVAEWR